MTEIEKWVKRNNQFAIVFKEKKNVVSVYDFSGVTQFVNYEHCVHELVRKGFQRVY